MVDPPSGTSAADAPLVPGWLIRLAEVGWRVLVTLTLGLVVIAVAVELAVVVASIVVALILAATLAPYVEQRRARGWGRNKAAGVVSLAALLVLVAAVAAIVLVMVPSLSAIISAVDAAIRLFQIGLAAIGIQSDVTAILQRIETGLRELVLGGLADIVAAGANVVTVAILGGFLTFFLLQDGDRAWAWVLNASGGWRRGALMAGGRRAVDQVGGYVRGTSVTAVATAVLAGLLMVLLGVPLAGPLAVVVLTAAFVPYVGRTIAGIVIVAVTLATRGGVPASALLVLVCDRRDRARSCAGAPRGRTSPGTAPDPRRPRIAHRLRDGRVLRPHHHPARPGVRPDGGRRHHHGARSWASGCSRRAGHVQCLGGQRRPGVAGSPGSMELALAHRGGVVHHRHPGGAAVAWGDPASRDGCDPRGDAPPGLGRLAATRRRSNDGGSDRHGGDGRRHHRRGRRDPRVTRGADRRADVDGDRGSRGFGRSGDRRRLVRVRHQ